MTLSLLGFEVNEGFCRFVVGSLSRVLAAGLADRFEEESLWMMTSDRFGVCVLFVPPCLVRHLQLAGVTESEVKRDIFSGGNAPFSMSRKSEGFVATYSPFAVLTRVGSFRSLLMGPTWWEGFHLMISKFNRFEKQGEAGCYAVILVTRWLIWHGLSLSMLRVKGGVTIVIGSCH